MVRVASVIAEILHNHLKSEMVGDTPPYPKLSPKMQQNGWLWDGKIVKPEIVQRKILENLQEKGRFDGKVPCFL